MTTRDEKGKFVNGSVPPHKGRKCPKMSVSKTGEKNPMWGLKGALSPFYKGGYQQKLIRNQERRARKNNAEGTRTLKEWQEKKSIFNFTCPMCSRPEPEIKLTEDHIVPLSKGGSNYIENIQPLCVSCNSIKKDKYEVSDR